MADPCEIIEDYTTTSGVFTPVIVQITAVIVATVGVALPFPVSVIDQDTTSITGIYYPAGPGTVMYDTTAVSDEYTPETNPVVMLQQSTRIRSVFVDSLPGREWTDIVDVTDTYYPGANSALISDTTDTDGAFTLTITVTLQQTTGTSSQFYSNDTRTIEESTAMSDEFFPFTRPCVVMEDETSVSDEYTYVVRQSVTLADTTDVTGAYTLYVTASALIEEETAYDGYPVVESGNMAWVAPTDTMAMSTWTGLDITSMAEVNGVILATTPNGIVRLTPNVGKIDSLIETGLTDFKDPQLKKVESAYLAYSSSAPMRLDVTVTQENEEETTYEYQAQSISSVMKTHRVITGRGLRSRFFRLGIRNVDGADFVLSDALLKTHQTARRV